MSPLSKASPGPRPGHHVAALRRRLPPAPRTAGEADKRHTMSTIQEFFAGKTVLVTGATGFLGKALVEKVLRSLPGIRRLYLLIRPKERASRPVGADERFW